MCVCVCVGWMEGEVEEDDEDEEEDDDDRNVVMKQMVKQPEDLLLGPERDKTGSVPL